MKSIDLYKVTATKAIQVWSISARIDSAQLIIRYGQINGSMQTRTELVKTNKSGRTLKEQMALRIRSRISKQKAKGYRNTIDEAIKFSNKNELNLYQPMLAQQFNKRFNINTDGAVLQRKLDGNRMLVTRQGDAIQAYTRNGKPIETLNHIIDQVYPWLKDGETIDGEVYVHGMDLKDINSRIKKKQRGTLDLKYHIYDVVDDRPFKERFRFNEVLHKSDNIVIEPVYEYKSKEQMVSLFDNVRQQGFEGLMMRLDNVGYQAGKRSSSLLKIKFRHDAEYEVIDVEVAKNGTGILVMRLPNGKVVKGTAPGNNYDKTDVANFPERYVGRFCTCSFAYLTEYGIPFHLTCDRWRD